MTVSYFSHHCGNKSDRNSLKREEELILSPGLKVCSVMVRMTQSHWVTAREQR